MKGPEHSRDPERTLADELEQRYGPGVDPEVTLPDVEDRTLSEDGGSREGSGSSGLIARLGDDAPRSARYETGPEIARGGMGAIHQVWDRELRRTLAMKVSLRAGPGGSETGTRLAVERFLEEAQITGQLDHPGVVPVHELGLDAEGRLYFTMKMVRGLDLKEVFRRHAEGSEEWSRARCLGLVLKACEAVAYAHDKGVIHRDLKPANVMVGGYGEVYVMDWGLARLEGRRVDAVRSDRLDVKETDEASGLLTADGAVVGTPFYMPPEQAAGEVERIGPHSDVYAMGAMLYELLAGRPPYGASGTGTKAEAVLEQVRRGPPTPLEDASPGAAPELVAICAKAMHRRPDERYRSVGELADDLRRFLEGRVVQAYRTGAWLELRSWVRRNRGLALSAAAAALFLVAGLATVVVLESRATERERTDRRRIESTNAQLAAANDALERSRAAAEAEAEEARRQRDTSESVSSFLVRLFEAPDPFQNPGQQWTARDLLLSGTESALDLRGDLSVQRRVLMTMSQALSNLGEDVEARPVLQRIVELTEEELGADHDQAAIARNNLARCLKRLGEYERAEGMLAELLTHHRRDGARDSGLMNALNNHASSLHELGRLEESETEYREALGLAVELFGETHPESLVVKGNLAVLLANMRRIDEALPIVREVHAATVEQYPPEHPERLMATMNLAGMLAELGKFDESVVLEEEALARAEPVLGEAHPWICTLRNNLSASLKFLGRWEEAEDSIRKAIAGRTQQYGEGDVDRLRFLHNLGVLLEETQRPEEAAEVYEGLAHDLEEQRPERVEWLRDELVALCRALAGTERREDLGAALEWQIEVAEQLGTPDHHETCYQLGRLQQELGRAEQAEASYRRQVELVIEAAGESSEATVAARINLGHFLMEEGRPGDGIEFLEAAVRVQPEGTDLGDGARILLERARAAVGEGGDGG